MSRETEKFLRLCQLGRVEETLEEIGWTRDFWFDQWSVTLGEDNTKATDTEATTKPTLNRRDGHERVINCSLSPNRKQIAGTPNYKN